MANLTLAFVLLIVFVGISYCEDVPCELRDTFYRCKNHYKDRINRCKISYVRYSCKYLCGLKKCRDSKTTMAPPTTTTTTTKGPKSCNDERWCSRMSTDYCDRYSHRCPNRCDACDKTTTMNPKLDTTTKITTVKPKPDTTIEMTTTEKPRPDTTTKKVTPRPSGGCGDIRAYCLMSLFKTGDCGRHRSNCPRTCGDCSSPDSQKCINLVDRANDCSKRNCRDSNALQRHRAHIKCSKYCCKRGELY